MALRSQTAVDGTPVSDLSRESPAKVLVTCDDCGKESSVAFKSYVAKQVEYGRAGETYCRGCAWKRSRGARPKPTIHRRSTRTGAKNSNFAGGKYVDTEGNVMVLVAPGEYRRADYLALEDELARPAAPAERVLHIDFDKSNNAIGNLVLLPDAAALATARSSLNEVALRLLQHGFMKYDQASNTYVPVGRLRTLLGTKA